MKYPLIKLKGKDYLQVAYRIQWLNDENKSFNIQTEFIHIGDDFAVCKAKVTVGDKYAEATKREDKGHFQDFIEKSETGAIGRALAILGMGTQFCIPDLDEEDRIVDSPLEKNVDNKNNQKQNVQTRGECNEESNKKASEKISQKNFSKEIVQEKNPPTNQDSDHQETAEDLPFEPKQSVGDVRAKLVDSFEAIGIRQQRICKKYNIDNWLNLTDEHIEDLRKIYKQIKQGKLLQNTVFPQVSYFKK